MNQYFKKIYFGENFLDCDANLNVWIKKKKFSQNKYGSTIADLLPKNVSGLAVMLTHLSEVLTKQKYVQVIKKVGQKPELFFH